ncbi:flagellar hook-basal body complex protein FliE [Modestobacter marinus]|uniref:flagellar hook-basal body complex protein FliE n=1 Tax=Modestobacter marinus TaxID=477641 RepID=UPI001C959BA0|nr:flagellar hook-basal body complex protein FliE [Modestobacter marinus]
MTSPISGISSALSGIQGLGAASALAGPTSAAPTSGTDFASVLTGAVDELNSTQATADSLAAQAATGDLDDVHDYMIASAEARLATDTVVTLKNSAVAAFTEIMRMNV